MKKLTLFLISLMFSMNVHSQCNIYGDFNYYPNPGGFGWYVFYDISYGSGLSSGQYYQWTVNGVPAGTNDVLHYQFSSSGTYTICETISDPIYSCYYPPICKTINIALCPAVTTNFYATNNGNYNYTFTSSGTIPDAYYWTIDGSWLSGASSFSYTFGSSGVHTICLSVTSGGCTYDPVCYTVTINMCPSFNQNFQYNSSDGATYYFSDSSTGTLSNPSYNWKINGTTVSTSQNMNYTFTTQGSYEICETITANGCTYVPLCTEIYVCPPIIMEITFTNTGYSYTFTDESRNLDNSPLLGTLTRYWSVNTVEQSTHSQIFNYTFPGSGSYTVCLDLLHNSCLYADYCGTINVTSTDIPSENFSTGIKVYPSPVQGTLYINPGNALVNSVEVIDASGKSVIKKDVVSGSDLTVDTQHLATGVYTVILKTETGGIVKKIVK